MRHLPFIAASTIALAVSACTPASKAPLESASTPVTGGLAEQSTVSISEFFASYDAKQLEMSPATKAYRGIRDEDYGKWDDPTDEAAAAEFKVMQDALATMRADYDLSSLSEEEALSYRLFEMMVQRSASLYPFRDYNFLFDHRRGAHTNIPAFLINIHRVSEPSHAEAYVERIRGIGPQLGSLTAEVRERADAGIMPPDWVYPYVIADLEALIAAGNGNAVLEDFAQKLGALGLNTEAHAMLMDRALNAWSEDALPAYKRLLTEMKRQQAIAPTDDGIWRLPEGEAYYAARLKSYTTTDLTADEIHNIGLREVERIHGEMREIMKQVEFEGSLQDFFEFTRTGDQFFYSTREAYLADAQAKLDVMEVKLPEYFGALPKAPMIIKPVEAFREKSAGKAFYQSPAADGSRPGTYYVNLYNLRDMSKNELEALAYHEGFPGHHLQRALQTELGDVPPFRRFGGVTAYTEGWGLYTEELGKDMGFYQDPYSDFGRLGMELWRACRLVVDTGLHSKRWTREEAIQYLQDNTPNPQGDIVKAIERYITTPGQATAYMIGKLKIMELRSMAQTELGDDFDWRGFHDAVLLSGPVPLDILEENVVKWVESEKAG
ncbi:DUF885 domain-containing protein [Erythrobacter crassostreae]|uniref:DUF885 domain-containing protein n=1 Tax=Erythrobacter crassostreae TaxID=2828328 RepID=A0A9X1F1I5_9SPHN|nr:DUF885 domain-containing protein [Erythrobacter crassostrea]MBV7258612.1 DUF885 domain-containing protein [Erythrobacter crassostrea]